MLLAMMSEEVDEQKTSRREMEMRQKANQNKKKWYVGPQTLDKQKKMEKLWGTE